jgi:hypothetical protein
MRRKAAFVCLGIAAVFALSACGKTPPEITEAEGLVLLDNEPLPFVQIQFVPELTDFGSQYNSTAVSDKDGKFKLTCGKTGAPGAVVSMHRVVVSDFTPKELRGESIEAQEKMADYYENLKNRPIPTIYGSVGKTPLRVEVISGQSVYVLRLTRPET